MPNFDFFSRPYLGGTEVRSAQGWCNQELDVQDFLNPGHLEISSERKFFEELGRPMLGGRMTITHSSPLVFYTIAGRFLAILWKDTHSRHL